MCPFSCILKNLPVHQAGLAACCHWIRLDGPLPSLPTPQSCCQYAVGPSAHTGSLRESTMRFTLAPTVRMWSRVLFMTSHGILLLITMPQRVIIPLSDWIFLILMDRAILEWSLESIKLRQHPSRPLRGPEGHTAAPCGLHSPCSSFPLCFPWHLICALLSLHSFYALGNLLKSFVFWYEVEVQVRKNRVNQSINGRSYIPSFLHFP